MTDLLRTALRGVGQVMITAGVVILLFCVYELYGTGLYTKAQQTQLTQALQKQWSQPEPQHPPAGTSSAPTQSPSATSSAPTQPLVEPSNGSGIAIIRIPRLGHDYAYTVVQGTARDDLKKGPGHLVDSASAGALGNFVISGHRTTYLAPFNRVDELQVGDAIVIETRDDWYTYRVTAQQIVAPTAIQVTYPVPGDKGAVPTQHLITLTTCSPKYSARQRLIISGALESTMPKSDGVPPALEG